MKQNPKLLSEALILFILVFCNAKAQMTAQDGRTYKTVKIGNQTWMAENLNVSTYRNGDSIPQMQEKGKDRGFKVTGWMGATKHAWCYYENNKEIDTSYGKLYNWYAVNDPRGLAPEGWHIPSLDEWKQLAETLGGIKEAGLKMQSTSGWNDYKGKSGNGDNSSGFTGLPGGLRDGQTGIFGGKGFVGYWWSSKNRIISNAYCCWLIPRKNFQLGFLAFEEHRSGLSVRCVKD